MKAYKGFDKDLKCRGFQYEVGKRYETESAKLCKSGFHACEAPLDVLSYYRPGQSRYCEVDLEDISPERKDDTKVTAKKIKIGAEIGIPGLVKAHVEWVKSHCTNENNAEHGKPATAGYAGAATAGNRGAATAGEYGAATAGYAGAATAGNRGAATAGNRGAATAGEYGAATSRGSASVGEYGIASARGNGCKVRGGLGAILVVAEEETNSYKINCWKAVVVDGETIKPDTWYTLIDGELVEAEAALKGETDNGTT